MRLVTQTGTLYFVLPEPHGWLGTAGTLAPTLPAVLLS